MKVFVVIAVHNRKEYTLNCLHLLSQQSYKQFEVVLVDDGSTDGTVEEVKQLYSNTHIVKGNGDWWWAKSMNEGFKYAFNKDADVVITLNNDVSFNHNLIRDLLDLHNQNPQCILGCLNMISKEKEYIFFSGVRKIEWWKAKEQKYHKPFTVVDESLKGLHPTYCLNGRGTLIPADVFKRVGYFDEIHFPQYAADYDFILRSIKSGIRVFITWDIKIYSILEATGEGRTFIKQSWKSFLLSFLNRYSATSWQMWLNYYRKHAGWQIISGLPIQYLRLFYSFIRKQKQLEGIK
ncbi:glycosyltransferase family 2 protein [Carboxylicivirga caseinilyticus]|uniref:glycosyltransferase family 2 protein n=1 Tax=Carboxylicivirga caseinilyticus TaxID=3417572 RepID=UPI003D34F8A0|nr:glycosyltransferase family 2 protein [Marinilabiliaceae bacterium A049]